MAAYPLNATLFAWNRSVVFPIMSLAGIVVLFAGNAILVPPMGALGAAVAFSMSGFAGFMVSGALYFLHVRKAARTADGQSA